MIESMRMAIGLPRQSRGVDSFNNSERTFPNLVPRSHSVCLSTHERAFEFRKYPTNFNEIPIELDRTNCMHGLTVNCRNMYVGYQMSSNQIFISSLIITVGDRDMHKQSKLTPGSYM